MAGGKKNASGQKGPMEPVDSKGPRGPKNPKVASANRIFSISGPKIPVHEGRGLGLGRSLLVTNGD